jgi:hypothetical protein
MSLALFHCISKSQGSPLLAMSVNDMHTVEKRCITWQFKWELCLTFADCYRIFSPETYSPGEMAMA